MSSDNRKTSQIKPGAGGRKNSEMDTAKLILVLFMIGVSSFLITQLYGDYGFQRDINRISRRHFYQQHFNKLNTLKASIFEQNDLSISNPSPTFKSPSSSSFLDKDKIRRPHIGRVYHVTSYGADPTGKIDSTDAILQVFSDAVKFPENGFLLDGIVNLGGARIDLDGGTYLISRPLQFPVVGIGNVMIHGGSLKASDDFPNDDYLIDLSPSLKNNISLSSPKKLKFNYEFITIKDIFLDSNFHGGGIRVVNSVRIGIENCYITHFNTTGIYTETGHETIIRYTYIGQHITAGGHPLEKNFSGIGIVLAGNDNFLTDVIIFSASIGILIRGQANTLSGVHCYNKAGIVGGVGIYLKTPGKAQTRIVNSYMDYTGIVVEDPVQLTISSCFFFGNGNIVLKSVKGLINGLNIVDNMFSGSRLGIGIVEVDESGGVRFSRVEQVVIDKNNARGMVHKATIARSSVRGSGPTWVADFNSILVFHDFIKHVEYTFLPENGESFPLHALRNVSDNKVVVRSNMNISATVYITVDQGGHAFVN